MKSFVHIYMLVLLSSLVLACAPVTSPPDHQKQVGDRAPIFSFATSQGSLTSYDRDYYGQHHLILTFVPAAFTPV